MPVTTSVPASVSDKSPVPLIAPERTNCVPPAGAMARWCPRPRAAIVSCAAADRHAGHARAAAEGQAARARERVVRGTEAQGGQAGGVAFTEIVVTEPEPLKAAVSLCRPEMPGTPLLLLPSTQFKLLLQVVPPLETQVAKPVNAPMLVTTMSRLPGSTVVESR